ncbi:MAG TPA: hypothetical protein VLX68_08330, partial [Chitinivibrionales bacterium]|nr:hypothetical protein [Chitinivibrionales bacterium]
FPEVANNWTASRLNASSYFLRDVDIHTSKNKDKFGSRSVQIQEYTSTGDPGAHPLFGAEVLWSAESRVASDPPVAGQTLRGGERQVLWPVEKDCVPSTDYRLVIDKCPIV